ncbi:MAG: ATP-binding protein [Promethearchaeota archaeon]
MSKLIGRSRWLQRFNQGIIAFSLPFAILLSVVPLVLGQLAQPFTITYLLGVRILSNITVICLCFCLLGLHNKITRRLMIVLILVGIIGVIGGVWFLIEVQFLGLPASFPSTSTGFEMLAQIFLILGLAVISAEQRGKRSLLQVFGYVVLIALLLGSILHVYNANLLGGPPVPIALTAGSRMVLSWLAMLFAWSFLFARNTPTALIDKLCRATLLITILIQFIGLTVFAFQYGFLHSTVPAFYFAGSVSDSILAFADLMFIITVLAIFAQTIEIMPESRPASVRYVAVTTILILSVLMGILLMLAIATVSLVQTVLTIFLPLETVTIAVQMIGIGFLSIVGILLVIAGIVSFFLIGLLFRPLEELEEQIRDVSEPGITAYEEPRHLLFIELQSLSDNFRLLVERMKRIRFELRKARSEKPRRRSPSTTIAEKDQYSELLAYRVTDSSREILGSAEALRESFKDDPRTSTYIQEIIEKATQIQKTISSVQMLRQIKAEQVPELSRIDMCKALKNVIDKITVQYSQRELSFPLKLPRFGCKVLANLLLQDLLTNLLQYLIERNPHNKVVIEVEANEITWAAVQYWQVTFTDKGNVIPDEEKDVLFRRDLLPARELPLSLLLAEVIADSLKGKIEVSNRIPGDRRYGTVFILRIPSATQN